MLSPANLNMPFEYPCIWPSYVPRVHHKFSKVRIAGALSHTKWMIFLVQVMVMKEEVVIGRPEEAAVYFESGQ